MSKLFAKYLFFPLNIQDGKQFVKMSKAQNCKEIHGKVRFSSKWLFLSPSLLVTFPTTIGGGGGVDMNSSHNPYSTDRQQFALHLRHGLA